MEAGHTAGLPKQKAAMQVLAIHLKDCMYRDQGYWTYEVWPVGGSSCWHLSLIINLQWAADGRSALVLARVVIAVLLQS